MARSSVQHFTSIAVRVMIAMLIGVVTLEILLALFIPAPVYRSVRKRAPDYFRSTDWLMQPVANMETQECCDGDIERPHVVQTNADGMRSLGVSLEKPPDTLRIMAMGDSFTFGVAVNNDETYTARLQTCLNDAQSDIPVQTINAGYNGFSHDAYYVFYHNEGYRYEPDMVIIGIYVANDLQDIEEMRWETDDQGLPLRVESPIRHVDPRLGQLVWREHPINYQIPVLREFNMFQYAYLIFFNPQQGNFLNLPDEQTVNDIYQSADAWNDAAIRAFDKSILILDAFNQEFTEQGIPFLAMLIPETVQLESEQPLDEQNPQALYRQAFKERGIAYIDLLPIMADYPVYDIYTSPRRHWTAQGHQIAAQALCDRILTLFVRS